MLWFSHVFPLSEYGYTTKLVLFLIFENALMIGRKIVKESIAPLPPGLQTLRDRGEIMVDKVFKETKVAFTRGIADIEEEDNADLEFHQHPFTLNNAALQRSVGMKSRRLRDDETETAELSAGSARSDNTDVARSGNERDVHMAAV